MFSKLVKLPRRKIFGTFLHGQKGHSVAVLFKKFQVRLGSKVEQNLHLENFCAKNPKKFPIFNRHFLNAQ